MIIAQISDTHILARDSESPVGASRARNLERCVADINRQQPDAVIYTGDMVQHGQPEEYDHLCEILAPLTAPLYPIPGNRDGNSALRAAFPDHGHLAKTDGFLHYAVEDYALRLIALDSTADGERKGVFCEARVAWLEETLGREPDKPTVLFIHHPPFDIEDHYVGGYRRPQEAEDLAAVVSRHPQVLRLLCGHVHCPTDRPWAGTTAATMPSIAVDVRKGVDEAAVMSQPLYLLHRWSEDGGLVSHTRVATG
jgi:3',5'-cyclic AMP phosphodiesterase CpdA